MSSIYLYIIYISRPWFKGSGAAAGSGSISGISILLCSFCRYAIVHTNHHFARKREYSDGHPSHLLLQLVGKTDACQRILIKNTPDVVRRPACFVVKGVQGSRFRVQGSGFRVQGCGLWVVGCGGGFAEILRLRSQLFWHSLSHIRRFSPLRMTKRGDARRSVDRRFSSYRQPSPRGEGAPKGRIGHWRYERERERASQVDDL